MKRQWSKHPKKDKFIDLRKAANTKEVKNKENPTWIHHSLTAESNIDNPR